MRDIKDYTEKYQKEPFEETMVAIRKKTVIQQCNKYHHDNILEIGCGMKPFFLDFTDYKKMVIAEPGKIFVDAAREFVRNGSHGNIEIIHGFLEDSVDDLKHLGVDYDFIILSGVLHELDDPQKMLQAIKKLCTDNTVVHINVPNANSLHRILAKEAGLIKDVHEKSLQMEKMQRRRTYDSKLLQEEVLKVGFKVLEAGSYFIKPFTHKQMQDCLDQGIINEALLVGFEKLIKYMPEYGAGIYVNVTL